MSKPFDLSRQLSAFTGRASIFPLPNVVLFPHLLLPLHIFEPRYRQMIADALADERLIAMALIRPDAPANPAPAGDAPPPVYEMACLGRITAEQRLADGRYYLVLQGLSRARIETELECGTPYRVAQLELLPDVEPQGDVSNNVRRLLDAFRELFPRRQLDRVLRQALTEAVPLGVVCDVLADAMSLDAQRAQMVLEELDVERRCELVLRLIGEKLQRRKKPGRAGWPPRFSLN